MTNRERTIIQQSKTGTKPHQQEPKEQKKKGNLPQILRKLGNRTIQRLMIQRRGDEPYQLEDESAERINKQRGSGAPLDSQIQMEMSEQMGFDLSGVRVHNSSESDALNRQLNAKAFTTGQDIFFKSGAYDPGTSGGKELLGHELTHVVQQGTGKVQSQGGMTVNAPGDEHEKEADAVASELNQGTQSSPVQTQEIPEEEEAIQEQEIPEEEEAIQEQEDEELEVQQKNEIVATKLDDPIQTQSTEEEYEELEENEVQMFSEVQRQDELPEEEI